MNLQASLFVYESFCPYRATNLRHDYPGRCPGLGASALSGRVASSKYMINEEGMHVIRDNYCFSEKNVVSLHCRSKIG